MNTQTHINKHFKHHYQVYSELHKKDDKHALNTMVHSQNSNKSTLKYNKVEFCLRHYLTFTPLRFISQKMYEL